MNLKREVLLLSFTALGGVAAAANGPVIGVAVSEGLISINSASVSGNANLAAGTTLRTDGTSSRLQLYNGSKIIVGQHSQVKVLDDRLVLDQGSSQISSSRGYSLEALGIRVAPTNSAQAVVKIENSKVLVAALNGPVRISNGAGVPLASVIAGRSLSFQPTGKSDATSTMRGRLTRENGHFILPDETSGLKVELDGKDLDGEVGRRVSITGTARASTDGSTQVIQVAKLNRLANDSPEPAAPSAAPSSPSPSPKPQGTVQEVGGMSAGIIVGLVATAAAGTIFGVKYGTNQPTGGLSR